MMDKPRVRKIEVLSHYQSQRLDNFLTRELKGVPKSHLLKIIRKGEVRVNGKRAKPDSKLQTGDLIRVPPIITRSAVDQHQPPVSQALSQKLLSSIVKETDDFIFLDKPVGLAVHAGSGHQRGVIESLRLIRTDLPYLELVHRLDKATSGILILAKKSSALKALQDIFRSGKIEKTYRAIVSGVWPEHRTECRAPLLKVTPRNEEAYSRVSQKGKPSVTEFSIIQKGAFFTELMVNLLTGRTHQIRVHTAFLGHPIVGDERYGIDKVNARAKRAGVNRMLLHCEQIAFDWKGEQVEVVVPPDQNFQKLMSIT